MALMGFSLYNAFFRWYWDKKYAGHQKSILFTILVYIVFQIFLIFILLLAIQRQLSGILFESGQYSYLIRLLMVVSALESLGLIVATLLRLKEQAVFYTILQIFKLLVSLVLTVYFVAYKGRGIQSIYEASIIANLLYLILLFNVIRKNVELKFEWPVLKEMLSFSMPLVLTSISGIILNITDRYALRFISDLEQVGIYSLGFKVANTLRVFIITSVNLALQPIVFKMMDQPGSSRFYSKVMTYFTFGLMFFVLFFSLYSPEIIKILSKKNMQFWAAYQIVPMLSFSMLFGMLRDVSFTGLNITKKTKIIALLIIGAAVFNILLNLLLIPNFGFYGASVATTVSQLAYFSVVYIIAQKKYPIPYEIGKVVLMVVTGVLLSLIGITLNEMTTVWRFTIKAVLVGSFPLILYPFGFYEAIELERMLQFWKKWRNPLMWRKNVRKAK